MLNINIIEYMSENIYFVCAARENRTLLPFTINCLIIYKRTKYISSVYLLKTYRQESFFFFTNSHFLYCYMCYLHRYTLLYYKACTTLRKEYMLNGYNNLKLLDNYLMKTVDRVCGNEFINGNNEIPH